jgi:hypothetical protein
VQASLNQLGAARQQVLVQEFSEAAQLLSANDRIGSGSEIGGFAAGGTEGAFDGVAAGRFAYGNGFSILAGVAGGGESYKHVSTDADFMAAGAVRYIYDTGSFWRPYAEGGAWGVPDGSFTFSRSYMNGAGTSTGKSTSGGSKYYAYGRLGGTYTPTPLDEGAMSFEIGHGALNTGAFAETFSAANPFQAAGASATDALTVGKVRAQWTHNFTPDIDTTVWAAGAHTFDDTSNYSAVVAGFGMGAPTQPGSRSWAEYGGRVGYKITPATVVDVFADGVSGGNGIGTEVRLGVGFKLTF